MTLESTVAIIPVRFFPEPKHRLAANWSITRRQDLVQALLQDVLLALNNAKTIDRQVIVTCNESLPLKLSKGRVDIHRSTTSGLNAELQVYLDFLEEKNTKNVVVVLADLPLLSSNVVDEIVTIGQRHQRPVLTPDWKGFGTNILFCPLPLPIKLCFGNQSFQRFKTSFAAAGLKPIIYYALESALDIDDDLAIERFLILAQHHSKRKLTHTFQILSYEKKRGK